MESLAAAVPVGDKGRRWGRACAVERGVRGLRAGLARGRDRRAAAPAPVGARVVQRLAVERRAGLRRRRSPAAGRAAAGRRSGARLGGPHRGGAGATQRPGAGGGGGPGGAAGTVAARVGAPAPGHLVRRGGGRRAGGAGRRARARHLAPRAGRPRGWSALVVWLVAGLALCSAMPDLRPRYLELVDPAVAAACSASRWRALGRPGAVVAALAPRDAAGRVGRGGAQRGAGLRRRRCAARRPRRGALRLPGASIPGSSRPRRPAPWPR